MASESPAMGKLMEMKCNSLTTPSHHQTEWYSEKHHHFNCPIPFYEGKRAREIKCVGDTDDSDRIRHTFIRRSLRLSSPIKPCWKC